MRPLPRVIVLTVSLTLMLSPATVLSQRSRGTSAPTIDWSSGDSARIAWLAKHGERVAGMHVVVWAPRDSISLVHLTALVDTLDRGVALLRQLIGAPRDRPLPWQRLGDRPVTIYLSPGRLVSHAAGTGAVFIPLSRALEGRAPYLHETVHELLTPSAPFYAFDHADSARSAQVARDFPLWLVEGIAATLAARAAPQAGVREADLWEVGSAGGVDAVCAERVAGSPWREEILRIVGGTGRLRALFTADRDRAAAVFYPCAESMVAYLIETLGVAPVVGLLPHVPDGTWVARLEEATGVPMEELRHRWRARIGT